MLRAADRPQERQWIAPAAVEAALAAAPHLSAEQREAVAEAARSDGVSVVEAAAGTGKTTLAKALVDAAQRSGLKVIGVAPSWVAADELSRSTGVQSVAIARWRFDLASGRVPRPDGSTVVVVDEAGMVGTRDLVGDPHGGAGRRRQGRADRRSSPARFDSPALAPSRRSPKSYDAARCSTPSGGRPSIGSKRRPF